MWRDSNLFPPITGSAPPSSASSHPRSPVLVSVCVRVIPGSAPPKPRPQTVSGPAWPLFAICLLTGALCRVRSARVGRVLTLGGNLAYPSLCGKRSTPAAPQPCPSTSAHAQFFTALWAPTRLGSLKAHDGFCCFRSSLLPASESRSPGLHPWGLHVHSSPFTRTAHRGK